MHWKGGGGLEATQLTRQPHSVMHAFLSTLALCVTRMQKRLRDSLLIFYFAKSFSGYGIMGDPPEGSVLPPKT